MNYLKIWLVGNIYIAFSLEWFWYRSFVKRVCFWIEFTSSIWLLISLRFRCCCTRCFRCVHNICQISRNPFGSSFFLLTQYQIFSRFSAFCCAKTHLPKFTHQIVIHMTVRKAVVLDRNFELYVVQSLWKKKHSKVHLICNNISYIWKFIDVCVDFCFVYFRSESNNNDRFKGNRPKQWLFSCLKIIAFLFQIGINTYPIDIVLWIARLPIRHKHFPSILCSHRVLVFESKHL